MANPTALESVRTGTPDSSQGVQIANISAQENSAYEIPAGVILADRIVADQSPQRSNISSADTTTDLSTSGFAGTNGANLEALNNRPSIYVWCTFSGASDAATIRVIYYDSNNNPLFESWPLSFVASSRRVSSSGNYISEARVVPQLGASKFRCYVEAVSGTVNVYAQGVS